MQQLAVRSPESAPEGPQPQPEPDPPATAGAARWTTTRWLGAGISTAVVVLAVLAAVGANTLAHTTQVADRLTDGILPAQTAAVQLEAALVNQETGVRGYGLTGQSDFLQPYTLGLSQQQAAVALLRNLTAHDAQQRGDLATVLARAARWQQRIAEPIAASPAGTPPPVAAQRADEGKTLFDQLRAAMTTQQTHLQQAEVAARADLDHTRVVRNAVFSAIGLIMLLLALLVFAGLRRGVARPLAALSTDTRRVTSGDLSHQVTPIGPADLRALAADVEAMRRHLVDELRNADRARKALDEQAEALRRSNQELEQFAYVASHDLQEPLRKVASFCQLLQRRYRGQLDERADQYIDYAVDGATRMQALITDLLVLSRVGRINARNTTAVDLEQCLSAAIDELEGVITQSGAVIDHDPLPTVPGDPLLLTQLLQNLLSNAIKFRAQDRPAHVELTAARSAEDEAHWQLAVTDNGIGIAPEFAERIFLIFQRLHTRDAYPGNGIGLALCRKIVDYHGGSIRLDTDYRDGTRIVFTLPAR